MWQCLKKENASAPSCIVIERVYLCLIRLVCLILLRRLSDRSALPSACLIRLVCCILLCRSSYRSAHPSACLIISVWAAFYFVVPLIGVFAILIGVFAIFELLLMPCVFLQFHKMLALPLLLPYELLLLVSSPGKFAYDYWKATEIEIFKFESIDAWGVVKREEDITS